jgi:hypothetical protein
MGTKILNTERRIDMADLAQRVNNIETIALRLDTKVTLLDDRQQKNIADVHELDCAIDGNGKPGLRREVALLTKSVDILNEFMHDIKAMGKWILITLGGIFITLIVNLILNHGTILAR